MSTGSVEHCIEIAGRWMRHFSDGDKTLTEAARAELLDLTTRLATAEARAEAAAVEMRDAICAHLKKSCNSNATKFFDSVIERIYAEVPISTASLDLRVARERLEESRWWWPRTVTYGLGWQDEENKQRIAQLENNSNEK